MTAYIGRAGAPAEATKDRAPWDEVGAHVEMDDPTEVVGVCEECGHEVRDTGDEYSAVTGHICADGFRRHPNGEGIVEVQIE